MDVSETGVNWGKCLRVRVLMDVTKKLVRGKRIVIEGGEQRWISFKYERLPNFCYKCGLLSHGFKECKEVSGLDESTESNDFQYGAWLRGEAPRRGGGDFTRVGVGDASQSRGGPTRKEEGEQGGVERGGGWTKERGEGLTQLHNPRSTGST